MSLRRLFKSCAPQKFDPQRTPVECGIVDVLSVVVLFASRVDRREPVSPKTTRPFQERKAKRRGATPSGRFAMMALGKLFDWRSALVIFSGQTFHQMVSEDLSRVLALEIGTARKTIPSVEPA